MRGRDRVFSPEMVTDRPDAPQRGPPRFIINYQLRSSPVSPPASAQEPLLGLVLLLFSPRKNLLKLFYKSS
jgi:hypothetical protein